VLIIFSGENSKKKDSSNGRWRYRLNSSLRIGMSSRTLFRLEEKNNGKTQKDFVYRYQLESDVHSDSRRGNDKIDALSGNHSVLPDKTEF
jgi:hypothetical protein